MRLLEVLPNGDFRLTENLLEDALPRYAILSHRWENDDQEVTFEDMGKGEGRCKAGYKKFEFCAEQAAKDGLQHFWVDSCCINKEIRAELSQAIRSMFRWYRNATRCYVYLSDVSTREKEREDKDTQNIWEQAFRKSKWFTRGWTLQELLAPHSVEFFSQERQRLGDRNSLRQTIHEVTCIPLSALEGAQPSQFSVNERFSWIEHRETKLEEDKAYSLFGIFGVSIPPLYGEGMASAFKRLRKEIDKLNKCIQALHITDPRKDKKRIVEGKGGLLVDSYHWVLEHRDFKQWRDHEQSYLLWIKGDPGKGKTMLLCGIVDELNKPNAGTHLLSYFFCQATDPRINNATAVLRGLLYLLIDQQPSLISCIQKQYDHAGRTVFEDANAWVAVSEIFTNVLQDRSLKSTYLIIDALDECTGELPKLLDFIIQNSTISPHVKWLVSSRNWPSVEEQLVKAQNGVGLRLELNAESVSAAVDVYIQHKMDQLMQEKKYDDTTRDAVFDHLSSNANGTFLWVALVYQNLQKLTPWNVVAKLNDFPPGLDSLYRRMMKQVNSSDNAHLCKRILALTAIAFRPVTLKELTSLIDLPDNVIQKPEWLAQIIGLTGSFLTILEDIVYFVHQSAKDYLLARETTDIFPNGQKEAHYEIFSRSLDIISNTIRRDIYEIHAPGCLMEQVETPSPDPLAALRYSCIYWINHLSGWNPSSENHATDLKDGGNMDVFLRTKYLYWLEALSLCGGLSEGAISMARLEALVQGRTDAIDLAEITRDAHRFIIYHRTAIEISPLQVYVSALIFSPAESLIRRYFETEVPRWIMVKPPIRSKWSACLQTLEGHRSYVFSVTFSHDSTRLASASNDHTIRIWNSSSGDCLQTLEGHRSDVFSVTFSHDSTRLASASKDTIIKIWDTSSGKCLQTLEGHSNSVKSVAFSHDSTCLASVSDDSTVKIWGASSGICLQTLEGHSSNVFSVVFSHNSIWLASGSRDHSVKIWDTSSGNCLRTLKAHHDSVTSVVFSHDSMRLASASLNGTVRIWNTSSGDCLWTLECYYQSAVAFSHDLSRLALASHDRIIRVWDISSGNCLQELEGHCDDIHSVAFSHDSTRLASASRDHMVRIWDASSGHYLKTVAGHRHLITSVAFSHDLTRFIGVARLYSQDLGHEQRRLPSDARGPCPLGQLDYLLT
ncbi:beta transducin-like protein HET-E2C40 [Leptodontidium sp. 2 PMI_412]|nr:beta transducin-like protein HET-E2C40 [Leptodontidium sp. 2 PMI_412]